MSRTIFNNIHVFCDGTSNGFSTNTSVLRLSNKVKAAIIKAADVHGKTKNSCEYFQGVGVKSGQGLLYLIKNFAQADDIFEKIFEAYKFVCSNYIEDSNVQNRIWFFGFSRGAYTVRFLAELINRCGVLKLKLPHGKFDVEKESPALKALVLTAYRFTYATMGYEALAEAFYKTYSHENSTKCVYFIGVWDTVGAIGAADEIKGYGKEFTELLQLQYASPSIKYLNQVLAVHEDMESFEPIRFLKHPDATDDQVLEEIWFPGYHLDVGGFIGSQTIPDATLKWMINRIKQVPKDERGFDLEAEQSKLDIDSYINNIITLIYYVGRFLFTLFRRYFAGGFLHRHVGIGNRDRFIFGVDKKVLYNDGDWKDIAKSRNYSSKSFESFREYLLKIYGKSSDKVPPVFE